MFSFNHNLNWYKKSKLIDKNHTAEKNMNSQCMYCKRWATHPQNVKAGREEIIWKTYDQLDIEEREGVDMAKKNMSDVSHGICQYCMDVINKLKSDNIKNPLDPDYIRDLSLAA